MQADEFLKKVRSRAGLSSDERARQVTDAVFETIRARISHGGADNIASQLPKDIKKLWESGMVEHLARSLSGVERMDLSEFLARVQNAAHLGSVDEAEEVTRAVFRTLQEQITSGSRYAIQSQLPEDIRDLWLTSAPPPNEKREQPAGRYGSEEIGPAAVSLQRTDQQIAEEVRELLDSSDLLDGEKIEVHVQQGSVVLRGVVGSPSEWEEAEKAASEVLGVTEVKNDLTIVERV